MDDYTRAQFDRHDTPSLFDAATGRTIHEAYVDPYEAVVITFTDGSHLVIRELGQVGEMSVTWTKEKQTDG